MRTGGMVLGAAAATGALLAVAAVNGLAPDRPVSLAAAAPQNSATPPLEPFEVERDVPLPAGVKLTSSQGVTLAPDGRHLILSVVYQGSQQVAAMNTDGTGFSCVTCGKLKTARGKEVFPDGKRLWVEKVPDDSGAGGSSGGIGDVQYEVLECKPSVYDCRTGTTRPVRFPIPGLKEGAQNRATQIHPDGKHIRWTEVRTLEGPRMTIGRLVRRPDGYHVVEPRVVNPAFRLGDDPADWAAAGAYYEAGQWMDGGRTLKTGTTLTALNYDMVALDMATGQRRRLTTDLDYNEMIDPTPDDRWLAYTSARGLDRMEVFTQLQRPPFIDMAAFAQIGRVGLWNNRRCMNERWLMDRAGQRGTYGGQPIVTADDWAIRSWAWFPDGTRAVIAEEHVTSTTGGKDDDPEIRVRTLRFPTRKPVKPTPVVDLDTLDLSKSTVPYLKYRGVASRQIRDRTVHGAKGGTARLTFTGTFLAGSWSVRYDRYSDDGRSFVTGTESLTTPLSAAVATWKADLKATGRNHGHLRGSLTVRPPAKFTGTVESEINGRRLSGVPTQADCPGIHQPPLAVATGGRSPAGTVRVRVTATVPQDPTPRPVRGAAVSTASGTVTTDADGVAYVPAGSPKVTATAGGFKPASTRPSTG
ncbi:carboxypeptidase-like regulatory domain-containing protein [Actinomadura sp. K4S16]|uniref:carboxypeptidase-like regulatory domain-containing protein n=1 Tax=Actinomadura sp. K4S16 TaxID=1316147 RepID=UPI0011EE61D6|nr:carboxypeptidase-like regulatory domain-containing protein [Actinomadura sp. K4S16]